MSDDLCEILYDVIDLCMWMILCEILCEILNEFGNELWYHCDVIIDY